MNKNKNVSYTMLQCVHCGFEHKETEVYKRCIKCDCKQFHLVKRYKKDAVDIINMRNKKGNFTFLLWVILLIVMITYIILKILKMLGWL